MRKVLLLAAAAIMVPGVVSAQSTANQADANQADSQTTSNAQSGMGDTANPMASDTHIQQGSTAGDTSTSASDASSGATMSSGATTAGSSADMSSAASTDTSSPSSSMNKTYPKCSRTLRDSCRNPGGK
jgi:hypothetical protein